MNDYITLCYIKICFDNLPSQSEWRRGKTPFVVSCNYWRPTAFENNEAEYCYYPLGQGKSPNITTFSVCGAGGRWITPTLMTMRRKRLKALAGQSGFQKDYPN
jgi:hypothetical protein